MPAYRLKPRLPMWRISGLAAIVLLLPMAVGLALPQLSDDRSPVVLGALGESWEIPISWPSGEALTCDEASDLVIQGWDCGGTTIASLVMTDSRDPENTLRRALRAVLMMQPEQGELVRDGGVLLLETSEGIAISKPGDDGKTMVAVVSGEHQRPYSALILHTFRGGLGRLPDLSEIEADA